MVIIIMLKDKTSLIRAVKPALIAFFSVILVFFVILLCNGVPSSSMESTIREGTFIISFRLPAYFSNPDRGDIVVFHSDEKDMELVKRVIAVGGDCIELKDGYVYLNGELLEEPYATGKTFATTETVFKVPEGHFWALGDNRENSNDSRSFNSPYIPYSKIEGYVFLNVSFNSDIGWYVHTVN